ncbi:MAG: bifunctional adenosylcobinamide kinase/adenosylcobinamide-phosphate guanylyltransferase [Pseudomonadota bacterium]
MLGGASSGKSTFAERLVVSSGKPRVYLATAQAFDAEMREKIDQHVSERGSGWTTIEEPLDLAAPLASVSEDQVVLLDCATMWLSNHMLAENDLEQAQTALLQQIDGCNAQLVIVSNEVGQGIVPDNALSRRFRQAQGGLNVALAQRADLVVQVLAGLPNVLKGTLP